MLSVIQKTLKMDQKFPTASLDITPCQIYRYTETD